MEPAIDYLRGEVLVQEDTLSYFPASKLPASATDRFARLFDAQPLWQREALLPYIADLASPGQNMEALLLAHARAVQCGCAQLYGPRMKLGTAAGDGLCSSIT